MEMFPKMENYSNISSTPNISEFFIFTFCHLVDFPKNGIDCSTTDPSKCVQCPVRGAYFTGENVHNYASVALIYYYIIGIIVVLTSLVGVLSNILIIKVMVKSKEANRSFDFLLIILAIIDLFCSIVTVQAPISSLSYFGNWFGRGKGTLYWVFISLHTALFGRSLSTYITILITIERFVMITFPLKAKHWFTPWRTKIMVVIAVVFAILMNYQRYASWSVEKNNWRDVKSLQELDYILRQTAHGVLWYKTLRSLHNQIDFWLPLPVLLLLNLLSYRKVHQLSKRRKEMNMKENRDIRALRMFLPIVVAYFITNIELIVNLVFILFLKVTYREFYMLMYLSVAANAAVNFPIYYFRNVSFRKEAHKELVELVSKLGLKSDEKYSFEPYFYTRSDEVQITKTGNTPSLVAVRDSGLFSNCSVETESEC